MQKRTQWEFWRPLLVAGVIAVVGTGTAFAQTSSNSDNYKATEMQFGGGSMLNSCSGQYCARASIGNMSATTGGASGGNAEFQPNEGSEPRLEVIVDPGVSNLGVLTAETTATKTTVVRINNYLVGGYTLQLIGDPPKFGNHTLATSSSASPSNPGTEQFAINLAANTYPAVGTAPTQVPTGQAVFGAAEPGYATANSFKFNSEEVIARSSAESGRTDFTISMIINISNSTPAGHYTGEYTAVVVPAY